MPHFWKLIKSDKFLLVRIFCTSDCKNPESFSVNLWLCERNFFSIEDIAEAYHKLRRLVMDYLGISSLSPVAQANNMNEAGKSETQHAASGETSTNQTTGQSRPKLSGTEHTSPTRCHVSSAVGKGIVVGIMIRNSVVFFSLPQLHLNADLLLLAICAFTVQIQWRLILCQHCTILGMVSSFRYECNAALYKLRLLWLLLLQFWWLFFNQYSCIVRYAI